MAGGGRRGGGGYERRERGELVASRAVQAEQGRAVQAMTSGALSILQTAGSLRWAVVSGGTG